MQNRLSRLILVSFVATVCFSILPNQTHAKVDLNGIGAPVTAVQEQVTQSAQVVTQSPQIPTGQGGAEAIGGVTAIFDEVGVDGESAEKAKSVTAPLAYWANFGFAVLLSVAFILMFFITGVDLLFIAVPFTRKWLAPEQQDSGGGGMGGFGGGGFGGGGFGGGMGGGQQSSGAKIQLISDEAKAALAESQPQGGGGGGGFGGGGFGGGFGGGGFGGGGFGGGGFGGGGGEQPKAKSMIITYFKKRIVFLFAFGFVALVLSTTIFTDFGISVGTWALNRLFGINDSFPQ